MIISIDGYDGTGKTTLAKSLAKKFNFTYLEKPAILMLKEKYLCSYEEAEIILQEIEKKLFSSKDKVKIAKFYCETLVWLKKYSNSRNIILDRGFLTTYAVIGYPETELIFDDCIKQGGFFDGSIYLTANDETRVKRIFERNPTDPDLKRPVKWHENNLEEYATSRHLNYIKINTENLNPNQVLQKAINIVQNFISNLKNNCDRPLE